MKVTEIKIGQLFGVHFPGNQDPEFRKQKFGYRVVNLRLRSTFIHGYDGIGVEVVNVKNSSDRHIYAMPASDVPSNWTLVEDVVESKS